MHALSDALCAALCCSVQRYGPVAGAWWMLEQDVQGLSSCCAVPCCAVQGYGPEAVKLLLAAGADPLQQNVQGLTALAMTGNQVGVT